MDLLDEFGKKKPWSKDDYSYRINVKNYLCICVYYSSFVQKPNAINVLV
jgi:hypothetical protein